MAEIHSRDNGVMHNGHLYIYYGTLHKTTNNNNQNNHGNDNNLVNGHASNMTSNLTLIGRHWTQRELCTEVVKSQLWATPLSFAQLKAAAATATSATPSLLELRMLVNWNIHCSGEAGCYGVFKNDCLMVEGFDEVYRVADIVNCRVSHKGKKRAMDVTHVDDDTQKLKRPFTNAGGISAKLANLLFDVFEFSDSVLADNEVPLVVAGRSIFQSHNLLETYKIDVSKLSKLLTRVYNGMKVAANEYHNEIHVLDVLQSTHAITLAIDCKVKHTDEDKLSLFLAAIIHDFEHRGVSNPFLSQTNDEWAKTAGENAPPNETHHANAGLALLADDDSNILANCDVEVATRVKQKVVDIVLATDMDRHKTMLAKFKEIFCDEKQTEENQKEENQKEENQKEENQNEEIQQEEKEEEEADVCAGADDNTLLLIQFVLKVSDLGHAFAPWDVHKKWAERLEKEFWSQGDKERQANLEISFLMDRNKTGVTKSQPGFYDFLVLPLLEAWCCSFSSCDALRLQAQSNKKAWTTQASQ